MKKFLFILFKNKVFVLNMMILLYCGNKEVKNKWYMIILEK